MLVLFPYLSLLAALTSRSVKLDRARSSWPCPYARKGQSSDELDGHLSPTVRRRCLRSRCNVAGYEWCRTVAVVHVVHNAVVVGDCTRCRAAALIHDVHSWWWRWYSSRFGQLQSAVIPLSLRRCSAGASAVAFVVLMPGDLADVRELVR